MTTVSKGYRAEYKIRQWYIDNGYEVDFKHRNRYSRNVDIFNLWDLIAVKGTHYEFIQVKTTLSGVSSFKRKSHDWLLLHGNTNIEYKIVLVEPRKPMRWWLWSSGDERWLTLK